MLLRHDSTTNTIYVSYDTLIQLGNLSLMLKSLGDAVDGYVIAIEDMEPMTSTPTLTDAMGSMLQLSGDIGVMSNRILEMADQILVIEDGRILERGPHDELLERTDVAEAVRRRVL